MELPGSQDYTAIPFTTETSQEEEMCYSLGPAEGS